MGKSDKGKKGGEGELSKVRERINQIDTEIVRLLSERRKQSEAAATVKHEHESDLRDFRREEELIVDRIEMGRKAGLDSHFVSRIFEQLLEDSNRIQQHYIQDRVNGRQDSALVKVAYQGVEGAYSHLAGQLYFDKSNKAVTYVGYPSFAECFESVEKGRSDCAIVPIENTASGGINEVYDLLVHTQLLIVGEEKLRIRHCLAAPPKVELAKLSKIYCQPAAYAQCSIVLAQFGKCSIEYLRDTDIAAQVSGAKGDFAVVTSEEVARSLGYTVLKSDIGNQAEAYTRYIIVSKQPARVDTRVPAKTSMVISTSQEPGALANVLLAFREREINLTKLESRPIKGNAWEQAFHLDFEGNIEDEKVRDVVDAVTKKARFVKLLGCYPSQDIPITKVAVAPAKKASVEAQPKETSIAPKKSSGKSGYKLGSREFKSEDTIVTVRGVAIGGSNFVVMAGPCSVESPDQIMSCAKEAREHGALVLRGGCFKPRTSPYSFQGLGFEGLDLLVEAGRRYDMPVITEVMSPEDVEKVAEKADILQIGARNMQNFSLLSVVGRVHRPVMLKRGLSSSIEELLNAAEYILAGGNQQVMLCERGIRTFETATRTTLDISAVPVLKSKTHLPIIIDPSHAAGERDLVPPLALAAKAVGAHGIIVEFHPEPEKALSDGPQALRYPQFEAMMAELLR